MNFRDFLRPNLIKLYTNTHHFLTIFWGSMPPNPSSKVYDFIIRSMSLCNMQIYTSEKN